MVECAASHEGEGDDLDEVAGHEALDLFVAHHVVEGVEEWADVGVDFLLHVAGEEAEAFACFYCGAYEDEFACLAAFHHGDGCCDGEVCFSCACGAAAEDEVVVGDGFEVASLAFGACFDAVAACVDVEAVAGGGGAVAAVVLGDEPLDTGEDVESGHGSAGACGCGEVGEDGCGVVNGTALT